MAKNQTTTVCSFNNTMRFIYRIIFVAMLTFPSITNAQFISSVGVGPQYGGVLGWQGSIQAGNNNLHIGLGLPGLSLGYKYAVTHKISIGLQGYLGVALGYGPSLNYYFSSTSVGWMIALDGYTYTSFSIGEESYDTGALLSVGYFF